jgi:SprT protein
MVSHMAPVTLNQQQQHIIISRTHALIARASELFACELPAIDVVFDLRGRAAGMYRIREQQRSIRYNPYIFAMYFNDNLDNTVVHEVAHYVADMLYGFRNIKPHGRQWQDVMRKLGAEPTVTCHYDLGAMVQRRQQRFQYYCACMSHELSAARHYRVVRNRSNYVCNKCNTTLKPGTK